VPPHLNYLFPFLALALAYWVAMSRKQQQLKASTASMRVDEVARQLGMTLLQGDPAFHMFLDATPSMGAAGALLAGTRLPYASPATEILARGAIEGRPTELYFYAKANVGMRFGLDRDTEVIRVCRLSVTPQVHVADFELVLRDPRPGAEAERVLLEMPETRFGETRLDQRYQLFTSSSDVVRLLSGALAALDDQTYVHVVGQEGRVSMLFSLGAIHLLATTPRMFLQKLAILAQAFERRA
jgi:hypothetical protein